MNIPSLIKRINSEKVLAASAALGILITEGTRLKTVTCQGKNKSHASAIARAMTWQTVLWVLVICVIVLKKDSNWSSQVKYAFLGAGVLSLGSTSYVINKCPPPSMELITSILMSCGMIVAGGLDVVVSGL